MTFADAAVEVLRLVGRPMHFKKITQVAIAKNLLSHVGKTPDVTMSARLAAAVTKDRGAGPIVRTKAGIFALREWGDAPPNGKEVGENDPLPIEGGDDGARGAKAKGKGKAEEARHREDGKKKKDSKDAKGGRGKKAKKGEAAEEPAEEAVEPEGRSTTPEPEPPAIVAEAAVEAEDDDGADDDLGDDDGADAGDDAGAGAGAASAGAGGAPGVGGVAGPGQGRRRRRRRRRRGGERPELHGGSSTGPIVEIVGRRNGGTAEPAFGMSGARPAEASADDNGGTKGSGAYPVLDDAAAPESPDADLIDEMMSDRDEERELIPGLGRDRGREHRERGERAERGERPERIDRERAEQRMAERERDRERRDGRPQGAAPQAKPDDTLADGAYRLLFGQERTGGVPVRQLADQAMKAHMLPADSSSPWMVIGAALRADIQRRQLAGTRPRFRALSGGRWGLFEWGVGGEALRLESEATSVAERQREAARRTLLRRVVDMGDPQFEHLVLLLVDRLGYEKPRRVTRAGAHRELHLAATSRLGPGGVSVALVFARSGREIDAARVTELRGALHHYGAAMGWIVTTGSISSAARDEADAAGAAPIGLTDGAGLARLFEETGVGLVKSKVELSYLDVELLDALKSGA